MAAAAAVDVVMVVVDVTTIVGVAVEIVGGMIVGMHPPIVGAVVVDHVRLRGMDIVLRGKYTTNISHWILPIHIIDAYCFV